MIDTKGSLPPYYIRIYYNLIIRHVSGFPLIFISVSLQKVMN